VGTHLCKTNNKKATNKPPWSIGAKTFPVTSKERSYITVDLTYSVRRFLASGFFHESYHLPQSP
jgi:hypothetical protein